MGTSQETRLTGRLASVAAAFALAACSAEPPAPEPPPSILLVVVDTLRADAPSVAGGPPGTTPRLDALAAEGLRYRNAFAPAPWTLPSHATLFTGLAVESHGVGLGGRMRLPEGAETLAARLADAGYATAGFSENPIVSHPFGLDRGFEWFASALVEDVVARSQGFAGAPFDVVEEIERVAARRDAEAPFFWFVNLYDPHDPYEVRDANPFLPEGVTSEEARRVLASAGRLREMCDRLPSPRELAILRGLYLGEARAADAKLGAVLELARRAAGARRLVTIVTSDHGEQLGEHGLLGHEFSVRDVLVRVPLVVHGTGSGPAVVDATVGLVDLAPTILAWAGAQPLAAGAGRVLPPDRSEDDTPRELVSVWSDAPPVTPPGVRGVIDLDRRQRNQRRLGCAGDPRVFGDLVAVTRHPHRLVWFEHAPPELYDLARDPAETHDLAASEPEAAARLTSAVAAFRARAAALPPPEPEQAGVAPEALEALRALGYVE